MQRIVFLFIFLCCPTLMVLAQTDKRISIPYKQATGLQLTELMQKETGYRFSFDEGVATRLKTKIEITASLATVDEILLLLHRNLQLTWKQIGSSIVLALEPAHEKKQPTPAASIRGRIVDFETSRPLAGATVVIQESGRSVLSDDRGYYAFTDLAGGGYTLVVSYAGYQKNYLPTLRLDSGRHQLWDIRMLAGTSLQEVVVRSGARRVTAVTHTTDRQLVNEIRNANSIVTGISSEQISKSADRNAAQVVQRTSGVVIKDDKFPIVRGMDPRYNVIYLNDNIAPSTELYTRYFALDLIPSRIIDRILVNKSPSPETYGDMSGGAIRIYTKDARLVKHFDIEIVGSDRIGTSFKPLLTYSGGKYDYLGFDDGTRKLPAGVPGFGDLHKSVLTQQQYLQQFSPVLQYGYKTALPDLQLTTNYYNSWRIGKRWLSSLTAFNYRYEAQRNDIFTQKGNTNEYNGSDNNKQGYEDQNVENAQANLLQNFTLRLQDSGKLYFRNFLLEDASKFAVVRLNHPNMFPVKAPDGYLGVMRKDNILSFTQRLLYAGNLGGVHYLHHRQHTLGWNLGYTYSRQNIPDQRIVRLQHWTYTAYPDPYTLPSGVARPAEGTGLGWESYYRGQASITEPDAQVEYGTITRLWLRNTEGVYNASANYDLPLNKAVTLKAGTFHQWKERSVYRKQFRVNDAQESLGSYPPGYYSYADWGKIDFKEQDLGRLWSSDYFREDGTGLKVYDNTQTQDSYIATEQLNAGYISLLAHSLKKKLDIYAGLRVEYDRQKLAAAPGDVSGTIPIFVDRPDWSWLPSLNVNFRALSNLYIRAGYGRSLNRPEFREISPFANFDFLTNEIIGGNPRLVSARLNNYDLRLEWYPAKGRQDELIHLGAFYKTLDHPIERIRRDATQGEDFTSIGFQNADKGKLYGVEAEIRKNFNFIPGKFFRDLYLIANGAWIKTEVTVPDTVRLGRYQSNGYKRPLQGQAPYIANAGLFYDNAATGTKLSVSYNIAGTRIYTAGVFVPIASSGGIDSTQSIYRGSILELPRHLLDFSITQRIIRSLQIKLSIQNLLNEAITFVEDNNFNYKYDPEKRVPLYLPNGNPWLNGDGTQKTAYKGDNIFRKYYPGSYVRMTITYSF